MGDGISCTDFKIIRRAVTPDKIKALVLLILVDCQMSNSLKDDKVICASSSSVVELAKMSRGYKLKVFNAHIYGEIEVMAYWHVELKNYI